MKKFNTTAVCIPSKHYMVDLSERVREIKKLVDAGKYFAINRARQYGKTTTLTAIIQLPKREPYKHENVTTLAGYYVIVDETTADVNDLNDL